MEGVAACAAGVLSGSVSLLGFGLDSFIEVTSGAAVLWGLSHDADARLREQRDASARRLVAACFVALATYVGSHSSVRLWQQAGPETSRVGIGVAALSLVVMPVLARAKRRIAHAMESGAMDADARQTDFCAYLSAILLSGLLLNATVGWWWADAVAGLVMVPIIGREGIAHWRGRSCGCH